MIDLSKIVVIIPALNPNENLITLVEELKIEGLSNIIVINDGSDLDKKKIFQKLKDEKKVTIYENKKNFGKGKTIKIGIEKVLNEDIIGIVTVDADGQHLASDAKKVAEKLENGKIVLGERNLKRNVPFFSKVGNIFSSLYLKMYSGIYLEDTQTGLRGIPKKYFEFSLNIKGERFDYEMNFLKEVCRQKINLELVEIETIYEKRIKNFRVIKDSYIIYKDFFKNIISSIVSAIIDIVFFMIFIFGKMPIFYANIVARIISGFCDFTINKKWVFKESHTNDSKKIYGYISLFVVQMILNSIIVTFFSNYYGNLLILKILINLIIYVINFFIKKLYIF